MCVVVTLVQAADSFLGAACVSTSVMCENECLQLCDVCRCTRGLCKHKCMRYVYSVKQGVRMSLPFVWSGKLLLCYCFGAGWHSGVLGPGTTIPPITSTKLMRGERAHIRFILKMLQARCCLHINGHP